jgi:arylsulfatase A-like enzyme
MRSCPTGSSHFRSISDRLATTARITARRITNSKSRPPATSGISADRKGHWKNRKEGQPFFAVYNYTGCHESGIASEDKYKKVTENLSEEQRQDPDKLTTLPPYYPDTPIVREDWKRNYELITAMDAWAGELINELKVAGEWDNTIVMFWSDHGIGLPRAETLALRLGHARSDDSSHPGEMEKLPHVRARQKR